MSDRSDGLFHIFPRWSITTPVLDNLPYDYLLNKPPSLTALRIIKMYVDRVEAERAI